MGCDSSEWSGGGAFTSLAVDTTEELELCVKLQRPHPPQTSELVKDTLCLHCRPAEPQSLILLLEFAAAATYRLGITARVKCYTL